MSDETAQTADTSQLSTSEPSTLPPEAPQAPANEVTPPLAKDDISTPDMPEGQPAENPQTAQTTENPQASEPNQEQNPAPEIPATPPGTGTAQSVESEPFDSAQDKPSQPTEPIFSEPTPAEPVSSKPNLVRQLLSKARESIQLRKRKKLDRVMDLFAKRTNLTNDEVEKLLHVSDATATRYLEILEKENKIRQVGKTGRSVKYEKI